MRTEFNIYRTGTETLVGYASVFPTTNPERKAWGQVILPVAHPNFTHEGEDYLGFDCTICAAVRALHSDDSLYSMTAFDGLYEVRDRRWYARRSTDNVTNEVSQ